MRQYIILGAGGHAVVVADILFKAGLPLKGFLDDAMPVGTDILGSKVIGRIEDSKDYSECLFIVGIGDNQVRKKIVQAYDLGYGTAVHPSAIIGSQVSLGSGTVVMAGAVINSRTVVGCHCIINTNASVDHDNHINDFVHISPGVALGGNISIGECTHVGIGACVRNNISICNRVVVGAGAAVVKDIFSPGVYVGVPAKLMVAS